MYDSEHQNLSGLFVLSDLIDMVIWKGVKEEFSEFHQIENRIKWLNNTVLICVNHGHKHHISLLSDTDTKKHLNEYFNQGRLYLKMRYQNKNWTVHAIHIAINIHCVNVSLENNLKIVCEKQHNNIFEIVLIL